MSDKDYTYTSKMEDQYGNDLYLDEMIDKFRQHVDGTSQQRLIQFIYDESSFKADLLAWHREEVEKLLKEIDGYKIIAKNLPREELRINDLLTEIQDELRASLEADDE